MVKPIDRSASEHELMEFEQVVSVLIYVDLKLRVERMLCLLIVVGKCDNVVAESFQSLVDIFRP